MTSERQDGKVWLPDTFAVRNPDGEVFDLVLVPAEMFSWRVTSRSTGEWGWVGEKDAYDAWDTLEHM